MNSSFALGSACFSNWASRGRDQDQAANVGGVLCGLERHESAFAMAQNPDARCGSALADGLDPRMDVACVLVDRHVIGLGYCRGAAKHASLVDANRRYTVIQQTLS